MRIDLNADLAEGFGPWSMTDDDGLLDIVSSANVACGFHAGDPSHLRRACALAAARGVAVGAHVGYRDLAGFGRRFLDISPSALADDVLYQIAALSGVARAEGTTVRYVKPHGALYHAAGSNEGQAAAIVQAILDSGLGLAVLGQRGARWLDLAQAAGLQVAYEAFADRGYQRDGSLTPRGAPGALLHDPAVIAGRVVRMVTAGAVTATDDTDIRVDAASVCVHGDAPEATAIARAIREALEVAGVQIAPFAT